MSETTLDPKRGLVTKLCEVMAAVGYLQKKGKNTSNQNYSYIREADVVAKMRDEFASRNIFIFPSLVHHENVKMTKADQYGVKESYQTNIIMRWTIVDGDTMQERVCEIPGSSASPGDKGVYVAMTGSEKYLLMKSFLLPTGDDPEDDANEERGSKEAAKAVGDKKVEDFKAKKGVVAKDYAPALFYTWFDESQTARIEGDPDLKTANRDLLGPLYNGAEKAIIANADQLEALKYQFEQRGVTFKLLKSVGENLEVKLKDSIDMLAKKKANGGAPSHQ